VIGTAGLSFLRGSEPVMATEMMRSRHCVLERCAAAMMDPDRVTSSANAAGRAAFPLA
jgi:hypothetical protein